MSAAGCGGFGGGGVESAGLHWVDRWACGESQGQDLWLQEHQNSMLDEWCDKTLEGCKGLVLRSLTGHLAPLSTT